MQFTIHKAKTHLSRILHQVEGGEEVTLCRGVVPVAKIVPLTPPKKAIQLQDAARARGDPRLVPSVPGFPGLQAPLLAWGQSV